MTDTCGGCSGDTDLRKSVREGTNQVQRANAAPDPALVPVDERRPEHAIVFAAAYSSYLRYFDPDGNAHGTWQDFFATDVSVLLAVAAIEDVAVYRTTVKEWLRSIEDPVPSASVVTLTRALGAVFDALGTLARRLDELKEALPSDHPPGGTGPQSGEAGGGVALRATLGSLIRSQLSPMLRRLIGFHLAGQDLTVVDPLLEPPGDLLILGRPVEPFGTLLSGAALSADWAAGAEVADWAAYVTVDPGPYTGAYGTDNSTIAKANHLATHNLFTAICETFLGVYARVIEEAKPAAGATFEWDGHDPHYALFLAFLKLLEHARAEANTITAEHLDFYYREVLRLQERPARPAQAHVLVDLAKHAVTHLVPQGTLLKAGKDDTGSDAHFAVDRDLVANKATVAELRSVYRHRISTADALEPDDGPIFASAIANSDDGLGAKLTTADQSWHPFANKVYEDGLLKSVRMPHAEVGFAIASHYLWMAQGKRTIEVLLERTGQRIEDSDGTENVELMCRLTTEKGWIEKHLDTVAITPVGIGFTIDLLGDDPPITRYNAATHGYDLETSMPVLVVTPRHGTDRPWGSASLHNATVARITLDVTVDGLRTFAASNDVGPVDISKPFQAYGSAPTAGSALVIGSKEVFQKKPIEVTVQVTLMTAPVANGDMPTVAIDYLDEGKWKAFTGSGVATGVNANSYVLSGLPLPPVSVPDLTSDAHYSTTSRNGFVRFKLSGGFGTDTYAADLANWLLNDGDEPTVPVVPSLASLTLDYNASQTIELGDPPSETQGRFFHVTPFGHAEQFPPQHEQGGVTLLPRFTAGKEPAEAELYVGVRDLHPPQNLALLFQVVDGTADPLVVKPVEHIKWTYLRGNEWVPFASDAVGDGTGGLLASGIVTLAVPIDATTEHTLLPQGTHWIRLAVASASDAVCRLVRVATQALQATHVVQDDGATSHTRELPPGTITKLDPPAAAVKGIEQPFPTFGGRPVETPATFSARVSERLRHKDRAIAQWDYEHLILEAFPGIYQARCLNHTRYEPSSGETCSYSELATGHVTVVTIPDLAVPNPRDPLRPYTSLRVLNEVERFLARRMSCFATLHVRNPHFEEVRVDHRVRFHDGVDETFHVNKLKREIAEFLSPWAFRGDARPAFNSSVHKSVLVDFIEERPYVDYVSDIKLFRKDPDAGPDGPDLQEVLGSRAISILVSVPPEEHGVAVIHADDRPVAERCACGPEGD